MCYKKFKYFIYKKASVSFAVPNSITNQSLFSPETDPEEFVMASVGKQLSLILEGTTLLHCSIGENCTC